MIKNGRPYTNESSGIDKMLIRLGVQPKPDDSLITDLPSDFQDKAKEWVQQFVTPRKNRNNKFNSYSIKHWIERYIGHYITNNQGKDIMLQCWYEPVDPNELNWHYKINVADAGKIDILGGKL